tara:strand:- start:340 stop:441 length:102 start_codon:yes stop_codon:yes gene_type:complete
MGKIFKIKNSFAKNKSQNSKDDFIAKLKELYYK